MVNSRLVLAAVFFFSMALLQEGCVSTRVANPNKAAPVVLVEGFCGNGMYYGFAGEYPNSRSGFVKNGVAARRVFLAEAGGRVLLSQPIHNLGAIRRVPRTRSLVYFGPRGVSFFQPKLDRCGGLGRKSLFVAGPDQVVLTGAGHCALSADGEFAAFVVAGLAREKAATQDVYLVRILDGRILVLPTHRLVMGIAFRGDQLLVNTGGQPHRLWVVELNFNCTGNPAGMTILRRTAVPGRLVGLFGGCPVFEDHSDSALFIEDGRVSFQRGQIRDVVCCQTGVLAVVAGGRVMLWRAGGVKTLLHVKPSKIAGMGDYSGGFWIAERSGRLLLVSAEGEEKWYMLAYPGAGGGAALQ